MYTYVCTHSRLKLGASKMVQHSDKSISAVFRFNTVSPLNKAGVFQVSWLVASVDSNSNLSLLNTEKISLILLIIYKISLASWFLSPSRANLIFTFVLDKQQTMHLYP